MKNNKLNLKGLRIKIWIIMFFIVVFVWILIFRSWEKIIVVNLNSWVSDTSVSINPQTSQYAIITECNVKNLLKDYSLCWWWIFYKGENSDTGIIVSPSDTEVTKSFINISTNSQTDWLSNTRMLSSVWSEAAKYCDNLVKNWFDDWYLPSRLELNQMLEFSWEYQKSNYWMGAKKNEEAEEYYLKNFKPSINLSSYAYLSSTFYKSSSNSNFYYNAWFLWWVKNLYNRKTKSMALSREIVILDSLDISFSWLVRCIRRPIVSTSTWWRI